MVPADSVWIPRVPTYSGTAADYGRNFQCVPLVGQYGLWRPYYPARAETRTVWAIPRSLAATGGITFVFFSCR